MKSNTALNQSIFRQIGGRSSSISSSMIVCHPLSKGIYHGKVFQNKNPVGNFIVHCRDGEETMQADIDMSGFIKSKDEDFCDCKSNEKTYSIRPGGYTVFFSSQGESGFHVELEQKEKQNEYKGYSTKELRKGDVVISMLLRPGMYEVLANNQKIDLFVDTPNDYKDYQQFLNNPTAITISEKGFSQNTLKTMPGQGLVIHLEVNSNVEVKLLKATETKVEPKQSKTHRWVKPVTPVFKKKNSG